MRFGRTMRQKVIIRSPVQCSDRSCSPFTCSKFHGETCDPLSFFNIFTSIFCFEHLRWHILSEVWFIYKTVNCEFRPQLASGIHETSFVNIENIFQFKTTENDNKTCARTHSQMGHYFFSYLLTWEVDLILFLEIMPQIWKYVIFLSLKPTKVTSDFILN